MSDRKTKRLSGAEYRKRKLQRDAESRKDEGAIKKFLFANNRQAEIPSSSKSIMIDTEGLPAECTHDEETPDGNDTRMKSEDKARDEIVMQVTETINEHTLATEILSVTEKLLSDDPAKWPSRLSNNDVQYLIQNKPNYGKQLSYPKDNNGRSFSDTYFTRTFKNGEICDRSWLLYSPSQNRIFCFCCKLFADCNSTLGNDGFCDTHLVTCQDMRKVQNI